MRAIVFRRHSVSLDVYEVIDDMPAPEPGPEEVLVQVKYAAINRLDDWVRRGWRGLDLEWPHVPCSDFSGVILGMGRNVTGWQVGQRVTANPLIWCGICSACLRGQHNRCRRARLVGENVRGTCSEYVCAPARNLIALPDGFDMATAACASLVYVTAWHSVIEAGRLHAGEDVLIVGAGGGVNAASIQIAKFAGARVLVVASSTQKAELARTLGADWVHDRSRDPDWSGAVYHATQREGVSMVVDNVGQATWASSLRALRPGGRLVTVGGTSGYAATVPVNFMFAKHLSIIGSSMGTQADYEAVMSLIFARKLTPIVDSVFALGDFRAAMTRMLSSQHFGKIVIEISPQ